MTRRLLFSFPFTFAFALSLASVACGGAAPAAAPKAAGPKASGVPSQLLARYDVRSRPYPASDQAPASFAVTTLGLALVPTGGGVYVAGWNGWLLAPRTPRVIATAPLGGALVVASETDADVVLERFDRGATAGKLGSVPRGQYQLATTPDEAIWISGREETGRWSVFHAEKGAAPVRVASLTTPIFALSPANDSGAAVAVGRELLLVRRGKPTTRLAVVNEPIEGVAIEPRGTVLFTTRLGLYRLEGAGNAKVLATGLHGPIAAQGKTIYVMRQDKNDILTLDDPLAGQP